jgi:protein-disulfide isomerase
METKKVTINGTEYEISKLKMGAMRHLMPQLSSQDDVKVQAAQEQMVAAAVSVNGTPASEVMDDILFADYLQLIPAVIEFNGLGNEPSPQ